ncbi:MAG: 4Fe-4S binding protein [Acidobacteriota bacterium]
MRRFSVITDRCTLDLHCVAACLRDAIHPAAGEPDFSQATQLHIHPRRCIGCGACITACDNGAIFEIGELPVDLSRCAETNAAYYSG